MITYTVTIALTGDLESEDEEGAIKQAVEIADGLDQLARDLGLRFVISDYEVEEL